VVLPETVTIDTNGADQMMLDVADFRPASLPHPEGECAHAIATDPGLRSTRRTSSAGRAPPPPVDARQLQSADEPSDPLTGAKTMPS
jgi:hypothetical protein